MANVAGIPVWKEIGPHPFPDSAHDRAPLVIVGAGPVGLALALDLGQRGHRVVVLNRLDFITAGSKAICFAKRSLDIFDRLGVGDAIVDKGVTWNSGKVFRGAADTPIYEFDMLPIKGQRRPGFVNIQQYHVETILLEAVEALPHVEVRWGHAVVGVEPGESVVLDVEHPDGRYRLEADWLVAADGSRSTVRESLGLDFEGRAFHDNFLIADVRMEADRPSERWFWFDPSFHPGQSALMHKQPDSIWRLDFQLGPDIDREAWLRPEAVDGLVRAMLGDEVAYEAVWTSIYAFQCCRMRRFVHGRTIFAGDSAHLVSPFGARGCNGGLADAENLGWKLDLLLRGQAGPALLESYDDEAKVTADENILNSSRATDFMTPRTGSSRALRDVVLDLATAFPFARPFVNSGRLSTAVAVPGSRLNTPDSEVWYGGVPPGSPALDAWTGDGWLLQRLGGRFVLLSHGWMPAKDEVAIECVDIVDLPDPVQVQQRYALARGAAYLIRPDSYVAARWQQPTTDAVRAALARAHGQ